MHLRGSATSGGLWGEVKQQQRRSVVHVSQGPLRYSRRRPTVLALRTHGCLCGPSAKQRTSDAKVLSCSPSSSSGAM